MGCVRGKLAGFLLTMMLTILLSPMLEGGGDVTGGGPVLLRDIYMNAERVSEAMGMGGAVDPFLQKMVETVGADTSIDMVIQFPGRITGEDIAAVKRAGFRVIYRFSVVPALHVNGTGRALERLLRERDVFWCEYNERLQFFMDQSTTTINVTWVWDSVIERGARRDFRGIDGSGVTVVVLDSGIDAGHPDLDYGTKTIMNLKSDTGEDPWVEVENSDTSSGHGTHCAGTVAGNGDASGGARRGVAPGAHLIGLSVGEGLFITGAVGGLQWVYAHTRPGANPYNIRVVSNSWGAGGGEYSPKDVISIVSQRITYENNVVVVFAAGNSGGDGTDIQTSNYGNTPSNICVAAAERDGSGISDFSSKGQFGLEQTYPDVAAPGVRIWSTAARRTLISAMTKRGHATDFNPYYFPISGTSMATPHVAGAVALLFQACPSLKISDVMEEANETVREVWKEDPYAYVHEAELILEATARYMPPSGEGDPFADNYIPNNYSIGWDGKPFDLSQGFGLIQLDKAVGLALTLQELRTRDFNGDGVPDHPDATVMDALKQYLGIMEKRELEVEGSSGLYHNWKGEWSRFVNQSGKITSIETDQSHFVYIPEDAESLTVVLDYEAIRTSEPGVGTLAVVADVNGDGSPDWSQSLMNPSPHKENVINLASGSLSGHRGQVWVFNIEGRGFNFPILNLMQSTQYTEARVEYTVALIVETSSSDVNATFRDPHAIYGNWMPLEGGNSTVRLTRQVYNLNNVKPIKEEVEKPGPKAGFPWIWALVVLLVLLAVAYVYRKQQDRLKNLVKKFRK